MKKILIFVSLLSVGISFSSAFAATGSLTDSQGAVLQSLTALVSSYESRITALEDEMNRLRIENETLRARLGSGVVVTKPAPLTPAVETPKTPQEIKYNAIMSNMSVDIAKILSTNNITATGSIGLFEFIEPNAFFISLDDGLNPAGVTAFKTKVLFKYDANFNLSVVGVFNLDYTTQRYITARGNNPYVSATRIRVKNLAYKGKLLEEATPATNTNIMAVAPVKLTTTTTPPVVASPAGTGGNTTVTLAEVRTAYEKNKIAGLVQLATSYLEKDPKNIEVLTIRARAYYFYSKFDEAITDIAQIYAIQKDKTDCGIINDGARIEKALKGARGTVFTDLKATMCKK